MYFYLCPLRENLTMPKEEEHSVPRSLGLGCTLTGFNIAAPLAAEYLYVQCSETLLSKPAPMQSRGATLRNPNYP